MPKGMFIDLLCKIWHKGLTPLNIKEQEYKHLTEKNFPLKD